MSDWPAMRRCRTRPERIYLRFGRWSGRSQNYGTLESECGVSVYPARFEGEAVALDWRYGLESHEIEALRGRCVFPVTGEYAGTGSDGEPVLRRLVARPYAIAFDSLPRALRSKP